jgi:hypothetical protein
MEYQKLLNLNDLLKNPVEKKPWQYKIIDNILEKNTFEKLKKATEIISSVKKDDEYYSDGIWPNDFEQFGVENIYDDVLTISKEYLSVQKELLKQFDPYLQSKIGYYNTSKFNYSINGLQSKIHDEGISKTLVLVIYLTPENSLGTKMYNGPEERDFFGEIPWKPNRGFLMCSQPGVTWHSYKNEGQPRYTLNLYYEKMEFLGNITKNFSKERSLWFLNNMDSKGLVSYI